MTDHVIAIDQGTTSTRAIVFDGEGTLVATAQREHEQMLSQIRRTDRWLDDCARIGASVLSF